MSYTGLSIMPVSTEMLTSVPENTESIKTNNKILNFLASIGVLVEIINGRIRIGSFILRSFMANSKLLVYKSPNTWIRKIPVRIKAVLFFKKDFIFDTSLPSNNHAPASTNWEILIKNTDNGSEATINSKPKK